MTHTVLYILAGIGAWFLLSAVLAVIAALVIGRPTPALPADDDTEHA